MNPVVIAYDGSETARAAIQQAAELFPGRSALVATIWEPGIALVPMSSPDLLGGGLGDGLALPADPETVEALDSAQRKHATSCAEAGTELASSLGMVAEPHAVPDDVDVADSLIELARERGAAAIVVGTHGITGLRSHFVGSVTRKLIEHCDLPVVVTRGEKA